MSAPRNLIVFVSLFAAGCAAEEFAQEDFAVEACPPLAERFTRKTLEVDATVLTNQRAPSVHYGHQTWGNQSALDMVIVSFEPSGHGYVGWRDYGGTAHITPIDAALERRGPDVTFPVQRLRDVLAHEDGFAALYLDARGSMVLQRHDADGKQLWQHPMFVEEGSSAMHLGRIAHIPGKGYAAYFAHQGHRDGSGPHQGDSLRHVSDSGKWITGEGASDWICSHSHDERLVAVGERFFPVCLGDNFPAAIAYRGSTIVSEVQQYNGYGAGLLGGMVLFGEHLIIAEVTQTERYNRDFALVGLSTARSPRGTRRLWVTNTGVHESRPNIARLGDKLLLTYNQDSTGPRDHHAEVIDLKVEGDTLKRTVLEEASLPFEIGPLEDMTTTPSGDVVFAAPSKDFKSLEMQRIAACPAQ